MTRCARGGNVLPRAPPQSVTAMIKFNIILALSLLFATAAKGQSADENLESAILGTWMDARGEMVVEFRRCGIEFCGRIVDLLDRDEDAVDEKNPDPTLRSQPLIGLQVVDGLQFEAPNRWTGGTMYAPKRGMSVGIKFELVSRDRLKATASKFVMKRMIEWRRVR